MARLTKTVAETGQRLGLPARAGKKIAYGVKDGYLVQLACGQEETHECLVEIIRYGDPGRDDAVREAIRNSVDLAEKGVKAKGVEVNDGIVVYKHPRPLFRTLDANAIAGEFEALLRAVKLASPPMPAKCRICGSDSRDEPILLNDLVDRVCPACIERLGYEAQRARQKYEELPLNLPLAVLAAAVLAIVGAAAWAGITIATNRMYWAIAIGSGLLIGYGTTWVAGKGGPVTQVLVAIFTVISVLLGEILFVAYQYYQYTKERAVEVDWQLFIAQVPNILWEMGGDTIFALGGGLIGAYYAVRSAGKPDLEVKVEK